MDVLSSTFAISASALRAERLRLDVIASNLANANTTETVEGGPYRRRNVIFAAHELKSDFGSTLNELGALGAPPGVTVSDVVEDDTPPRMVFDPGHPDANGEGYVAYPNVNPILEMVDLQAATRAYEANIQVVTATRRFSDAALSIAG
ncbi:MAG TPA: flagellar basal body rod protein FlgC [Candidatus Binatia bacterium]|jgi:flagellar basal-body rod protein FlgC|nr:flagellar basal body rod protein FlgC [Candidatus Binatia bacterium]